MNNTARIAALPMLAGLCVVIGACRAQNRLPEKPIINAAVKITGAEPARLAVEQTLKQAHAMLKTAADRQAELRGMPGWARVAELAAEVAGIESNLAAGDLARAYDRATAWGFTRLEQQAADQALTAMPLMVLGPFHEARFASLAELDATNRAAYLQIPYLHEFRAEKDGTLNWKWLIQDFRPDVAQRYPVYGGERGWQAAMKTNALALNNWNTGQNWTILYLYTEIFSPEAREAALLLRDSENLGGIGCWLNGGWFGGVVGNFYGYGRMNLKLGPGWNPLVLKVIQREGGRLTFTIVRGWTHQDTTPMYDLRYRLPGDLKQEPGGR